MLNHQIRCIYLNKLSGRELSGELFTITDVEALLNVLVVAVLGDESNWR